MTTDDQTRNPEEITNIISEEVVPGSEDVGDEPTFLLKRQLIDSLQTNSTQRRMYARRTFWLTVSWIFLVIIIVAASGLDIFIGEEKYRVLKLSDAVVITLITTTGSG